ncbi:MAG: HAD family phosphatase [Phycisphaerae bacterium]|nr:HAD family phosphatase [Phycisphaerae bacterium]
MLKLVIFDFDGVIADTESAHFEMFRQIFLEEGIVFTWEEYMKSYLGYTDIECFTERLKNRGESPTPSQIADLVERKSIKFQKYIEENSIILPGVRDLLKNLRDNNIPCSICSGALRHEVEFILKKTQLSDYFTVIVAAEDVLRGKPDPQGFCMTLEKTNKILNNSPKIAPNQCVIIEDSTWGIQAALGAGIKCLAVATTYPEEIIKKATPYTRPDLTTVDTNTLQNLLD